MDSRLDNHSAVCNYGYADFDLWCTECRMHCCSSINIWAQGITLHSQGIFVFHLSAPSNECPPIL